MNCIKYSTIRVWLFMIAGIVITPLAWFGAEHTERKLFFACLIFLAIGPVMIVGGLRVMLGNGVALRWDGQALEVRGIWRSAKLPWRAIRDIGITTTTTRTGLTTSKSQSLTILADNGSGGTRKIHIAPGLLENGAAAADQAISRITECLERVRQGLPALGTMPASPSRYPSPLAVTTPTATARPGGFGRRGL